MGFPSPPSPPVHSLLWDAPCDAPCRARPCSLRSPNAQAASAERAKRTTNARSGSKSSPEIAEQCDSLVLRRTAATIASIASPITLRKSAQRDDHAHCAAAAAATTAADRSMQCGEDFVDSAARISIASSIGSCSTSSCDNIPTIAEHCTAMHMKCIASHRCSSARCPMTGVQNVRADETVHRTILSGGGKAEACVGLVECLRLSAYA